ncbi:MAG: hypothetical protein Ct9H300mP1_12390 [Planctomycetaceae bacterium]|nr:MAG: hypothetical protein Ct9H300mP1_12390 [Planctomycetaceae bacterium]
MTKPLQPATTIRHDRPGALLGLAAGAMLFGRGSDTAVADDSDKKPARVYELRTYTTAPGKLGDLHKRFADHTMKIFARHGMKNSSTGLPMTQAQGEHPGLVLGPQEPRGSKKELERIPGKDPEWKKAFAESRKNGPIVTKVVSQFLNPTGYSPAK